MTTALFYRNGNSSWVRKPRSTLSTILQATERQAHVDNLALSDLKNGLFVAGWQKKAPKILFPADVGGVNIFCFFA
jgi:hypothetical protein